MKTKRKTHETNRSANFFFFSQRLRAISRADTGLTVWREEGREGGREGEEVSYPDPPRLSGCKVPTFQL